MKRLTSLPLRRNAIEGSIVVEFAAWFSKNGYGISSTRFQTFNIFRSRYIFSFLYTFEDDFVNGSMDCLSFRFSASCQITCNCPLLNTHLLTIPFYTRINVTHLKRTCSKLNTDLIWLISWLVCSILRFWGGMIRVGDFRLTEIYSDRMVSFVKRSSGL